MILIKNITFKEIVKPLRMLFSTSLGKKRFMRSVIVKVELSDGSTGLGEVPTSFVLRQETIPAIKKVLFKAKAYLLQTPVADYLQAIAGLRKEFIDFTMTLSGLEVALFRAYLSSTGKSEYEYWGARRNALETDITVPFIKEKTALLAWLNYVKGKGFRTYKLKVSGDIPEDKEFLSFVYSFLKYNLSDFTVRLDGNQGFNERSALKLLDFIEERRFKAELFEQPLRKDDFSGLKRLKRNIPLPLILDETVFKAKDLEYAIDEKLCDGVNIKIAKSGIYESAEILQLAKKNKLKTMIGCMTETSVGISAAINFACGKHAFDYVDLDSTHFLFQQKFSDHIKVEGPVFRMYGSSIKACPRNS